MVGSDLEYETYFGYEYYEKPIPKELKEFLTEFVSWHKSKQTLYSEDILNMMIDFKLVSKNQLLEILKNVKDQHPKLPNKHI